MKSITAREIFSKVPSVKEQLWGGEFWTDGYFVSSVGEHATEDVIRQYIKNQGKIKMGSGLPLTLNNLEQGSTVDLTPFLSGNE